MLNRDQSIGISERLLYSGLLFLAMKFVALGYIEADMAPYVAAGGVALASGAYAWWINRPSSLLTAAGNALPENAKLVITTTPSASPLEKAEVHALAASASVKVDSKTTG